MQYVYLAHHGIKGQKWGVRRYQNADGSLTAAGRKRVQKYEDKIEKLKSVPKNAIGTMDENRRNNNKKLIDDAQNKKNPNMSEIADKVKNNMPSAIDKGVGTVRKTAREAGLTSKEDVLNRGTARQIKKLDLENVDTETLRKSYARLDVQQKVRQISDNDTMAKIQKGLNIFNSVTTGVEIGARVIASGSALYSGIAKINNSINPNLKMPTLDGGKRLTAQRMMKISEQDFMDKKSLGELDMGDIKAYAEIAKTMNDIRKEKNRAKDYGD